mgnify:CR=1 FL=1
MINIFDILSNASDKISDRNRSLSGLLRKRTYLRSNNCKASSGLSGSCRFDRGIERKKICLLGDCIDGIRDTGDLLDRFGSCTNKLGKFPNSIIKRANIGGHACHLILTCHR